MRRRNPELGLPELWHRLTKRGYTRRPESLFRVMGKPGVLPKSAQEPYKPKAYEKMQYPGRRVQIDVKVVLRSCITTPKLRLSQYTAIGEYSRPRFLCAYLGRSAYSSADFLRKVASWFGRGGVKIECVQTDNGFEFTHRFSKLQAGLIHSF